MIVCWVKDSFRGLLRRFHWFNSGHFLKKKNFRSDVQRLSPPYIISLLIKRTIMHLRIIIQENYIRFDYYHWFVRRWVIIDYDWFLYILRSNSDMNFSYILMIKMSTFTWNSFSFIHCFIWFISHMITNLYFRMLYDRPYHNPWYTVTTSSVWVYVKTAYMGWSLVNVREKGDIKGSS